METRDTIKKLREKNGLTQEQMAERLMISRQVALVTQEHIDRFKIFRQGIRYSLPDFKITDAGDFFCNFSALLR